MTTEDADYIEKVKKRLQAWGYVLMIKKHSPYPYRLNKYGKEVQKFGTWSELDHWMIGEEMEEKGW